MPALTASIPHSGLKIPEEAFWLKGIRREILLCDVDLFMDQLCAPALKKLQIPFIAFPFHRYAVDVNRSPEDIPLFPGPNKRTSGSKKPLRTFIGGIYWRQTTKGDILIPKAVSLSRRKALLKKCFFPFEKKLKQLIDKGSGRPAYHIDLHSMPSKGRAVHRDPEAVRPQVTVSDRDGASAALFFTKIVQKAFISQGFQALRNDPYKGGRITKDHGDPKRRRHVVQIELNRSLYMNETSFSKTENFSRIQQKLERAFRQIQEALGKKT